MKISNKRITKAILAAAKERREKMFASLSDSEIQLLVPVNKGYLYEYQNNGFHGWGLIVDECVLCGEQHKHGNGGLGEYSIHCNYGSEVFPFKYDIQLDMTDEDNVRLAEKYEVK